MATATCILTPSWGLLVSDGQEFLLTLSPVLPPLTQPVTVYVAVLDASDYTGVVADLTALNAIVAPSNGDRYIVQWEQAVYAWDADTSEWIVVGTLDALVTVAGHVLRNDPRTGQTEALNRSLIGPGHLIGRSDRDSAVAALTTWTP